MAVRRLKTPKAVNARHESKSCQSANGQAFPIRRLFAGQFRPPEKSNGIFVI